MSEKKKHVPVDEAVGEQKKPEPSETAETTETPAPPADEQPDPLLAELEALKDELAAKEDKYLRLAAEYDNFRKRSAKEKESVWADAKGETAAAFLAVYDNLERAITQPCADEAYAKGVEMTMTELKKILTKLGITEIPALGRPFDPALHNAVMHVEDESAGENTIVEVFQTGFLNGEKVLRFSMVKVAN